METVYRERANGRWEYCMYAEGRRFFISAAMAQREIARGARLIVVR